MQFSKAVGQEEALCQDALGHLGQESLGPLHTLKLGLAQLPQIDLHVPTPEFPRRLVLRLGPRAALLGQGAALLGQGAALLGQEAALLGYLPGE